jgi:signal transduction histidine kinase/ActR/RegA family two-component response regulator
VLAGSLDYEATLKSVARVAIPYLADYVLVDALDAGGHLHRLAAAHADPRLEDGLARRPPRVLGAAPDSVIATVLERGEPTLVRDVTDDWLAARRADAEHVGASAVSVMLVPLRARGRTLGVATFALERSERRYTLADLALAEDLAQRAALGADNARLYREAQDASRAKDEFLAVLSHELRTPLTPVLGWIRMLRTGALPAATVERALDTVERNTRLQVQLVEDLLDVSRIITGKLKLDLRPTHVAAVVDQAVESLAAAAAAKSIAVRRSVADALPPLHADANRLQQVVANLLANAVKFTPAGGHVEVAAALAGDRVELTVADTGSGMSPETAPFIFDRFHQADSTITRQHGGLGLGLAIVRHIVELHGGSVRAASPGLGQGTTVTVVLPLAGPALRVDVVAPAPPAPALVPDALAGVRVLVVDDEPDSRELVAAVLERTGADVATAISADEALRLLDKHAPEVLVSDLAMPERDGYALLRELRERGRTATLATVALSAQARPEDRRRALEAGYDAHIAKPVEPAALAMLVRALVEKRRRRS